MGGCGMFPGNRKELFPFCGYRQHFDEKQASASRLAIAYPFSGSVFKGWSGEPNFEVLGIQEGHLRGQKYGSNIGRH